MRKKVIRIVENIILTIIFVPLIIIAIRISYQSIFYPEKIPDIFGYKMFFIFDENMDQNLKYGDIAITYNKKVDDLKENNLIAFRNNMDTVTIHRINKITEEKNRDNKNTKIFIMNAVQNETIDTKFVKEEKVEGVVVNRIPKIGVTIYFLQQPIVILVISFCIIAVGGVCIYFAGKLDKKEMQELEAKK